MYHFLRINGTSFMQNWQKQLQEAIKSPFELLEFLNLTEHAHLLGAHAHQQFAVKVPKSFALRMKPGQINDPLLLQVLPLALEEKPVPGFSTNPLQENNFNPVPGLLHKYKSRVLITLTSHCAINCRYCFRRHFDYQNNNTGQAGWHGLFEYIASDASITEVILSGGDPLATPTKLLQAFTDQLQTIAHINTLRIHTRLPIALPARVDNALLDWITHLPFKVVIVTHCNHPQEINTEVTNAIAHLKKANVVLLNQTVLLKGVNDNADALINLSQDLFACGILPYYLHQLDPVQGAAHFAINESDALALHQALKQALPGYLVPKLVQEIPGATSKSWLS